MTLKKIGIPSVPPVESPGLYQLLAALKQNVEANITDLGTVQTSLSSQISSISQLSGVTEEQAFVIGLVTEVDSILGSVSNQLLEFKKQAERLAAATITEIVRARVEGTTIRTETAVRQTETLALATQVTTLSADLGTANAAIQTETTARINADNALSGQITTLTTNVNSANATFTNQITTLTNADTTLQNNINAANTARESGDTALSQQITTVSTTVGQNTAQITTISTSLDGVKARWGTAINVNGEVVGLVLLDGSQTGSNFTVVADKFLVAQRNLTGGDPVPVFAIATVNGASKLALRGDMLVDGSIIARMVAAGAITADKIAANAITAEKITVGAVGSSQLANGAVGSTQLASSAVASANIANGAVGSTQLATGAVLAQNLAAAPKSLNPDPSFSAGSARWTGFVRRLARTDAAVPADCPTAFAAEFNARDNPWLYEDIEVVPGEVYRLSVSVSGGATGSGALGALVFVVNAAGAAFVGAVPASSSATSGWQRVTGTYTIPANGVRLRIGPWADRPTYTGASWFSDLTIEKVVDSSLIANGAVGSAQVADGAIGEAKIANAAIGTTKIQDGVITTDKIAANAITATKIAANAITADKIAAGAITAATLGVTELSAITANLGTVTAGLIRNTADTLRFDLPNMRIYRTDGTMDLDFANKRFVMDV